MAAEEKTVRLVVEQRLCTSCGTCAAACPTGAIAMRETPAGFPRPFIDDETCTGCGLCYQVCSGVHFHFDLPESAAALFRPQPRAVYLGRAVDEKIHALGQSGGTATALLAYLMKRRWISHALVTRMPADGSLRPEAFFANSAEHLLECMGSKYCLNPLNAALRRWPDKASGVAVVALGCHVHGLRNLAHLLPQRWEGAFKLVLGLFCRQSVGYLSTDYMLRKWAGGKPVVRFLYRSKTAPGEQGHPAIEYADGSRQDLPDGFLWKMFNDKFAPLRCRLCFDQLNLASDLAVGDANGYPPEIVKQGMNSIAVYTERGEELLAEAHRDGAVELVPSSAEELWAGQALGDREMRVINGFSHFRRLGREVPDVAPLKTREPVRVSLAVRMILETLWALEAARSRRSASRRLTWLRGLLGAISEAKRRLRGLAQSQTG